MSLKILHVLDHSVPLHSGYAFRTLSILKEQQKLGWQTLQVTTPKQGESCADEESVEGCKFLRTGHAAARGLIGQMRATAARLRQVIGEFQPDLIHAHSPVLTVLPALYTARHLRIPVVYEVRATWEDAAVDHGTTHLGSLRYRFSKAIESFALRRADHVTTICEGLRGEIVSRGIAPSKTTVIPNAVDVDRFVVSRRSSGEARAALGLEAVPTMGFIGSFYGYEGLDLLLDALAIMLGRGQDMQLLLVGGGPEEFALRRNAEAAGIAHRVHFAGRVSHAEVQNYYDAIDLLVYPRKRTRLTELVTPLKPLEAMAQGKLVLCSDVGGHRELVRNGETGVLFPSGDPRALAHAADGILAAPSTWEGMRKRGREFVNRERSWAASVAGYHSAYEAALAAKRRRMS